MAGNADAKTKATSDEAFYSDGILRAKTALRIYSSIRIDGKSYASLHGGNPVLSDVPAVNE